MPNSPTDMSELRSDVSALQKEVAMVSALVPRFDTAIEKLTEVSSNVSKLLAVHETRLDQTSNGVVQITDLVEKLRERNETSHGAIQDRITKVKTELETTVKLNEEETAKKIHSMQKWIWGVSGGSAALIWIANRVAEYWIHK